MVLMSIAERGEHQLAGDIEASINGLFPQAQRRLRRTAGVKPPVGWNVDRFLDIPQRP